MPSQRVSRICFVFCVAAAAVPDISLCCYYFLSLSLSLVFFFMFTSKIPKRYLKNAFFRSVLCFYSLAAATVIQLFLCYLEDIFYRSLWITLFLSFPVELTKANGRKLSIFEFIFLWFSNEQLNIRLWNKLLMVRKPVRHCFCCCCKWFGCGRTRASKQEMK